jgi:hypothetical protein
MKKSKISIFQSVFFKILFLLIIFSVFSCKTADVGIYTAKNLFGTWFTIVDEPVDGKCTIEVQWNSDYTTKIDFKYENGQVYTTSSKWEYNDPIYYEIFPDGTNGKAKIKWINKNKFELMIIENQDTENYQGRVRVFERKK